MTRRLLAIVIGAATVAAASRVASAQRLDRSVRPVPSPAKPFVFPHTRRTTLSNGLTVVIVENRALPLVAVRAVVGADSLDDPAGQEGLYALTTAMLREGTASLTATQQSDSLAALGNDVTPFRFTTIPANVDASLGLMADMLMHPAFPESALARAKAVLTAAEDRRRQSFAGTLQIFYQKVLGADHPLARSIVPADADIAGITRDDIVRFHDTYFRPNNTTLVVVGDVRPAAVLADVRARFGAWRRAAVPRLELPPVPAPAPTTIYVIDQPNAPQTLTYLGSAGPPRTSRDLATLDVLGFVLGSGPASRLSQLLRDRHSYYYSGRPWGMLWFPPPLPSLVYGFAPLAAPKTDSALDDWMTGLRDASRRPPTDAEMATARASLTQAVFLHFETDDDIANELVQLINNGDSFEFLDRYVDRVNAIAPSEVAAAITKYVDPDHLAIVMSGDRKTLEPKLRALHIGPIVIVDAK